MALSSSLSFPCACSHHTPAQHPWLGFTGSRLGAVKCCLTLGEQEVRPQFPNVSRDLLFVTSKSCSWSGSLLAWLGLPGEAVTAGMDRSSCFSSRVFHNPVFHPAVRPSLDTWWGWRFGWALHHVCPSSPCLSHFGLLCLCWLICQQKGGMEAEQNFPGGICRASTNVGQISMG